MQIPQATVPTNAARCQLEHEREELHALHSSWVALAWFAWHSMPAREGNTFVSESGERRRKSWKAYRGP